jgi:glycosyltransferase involved in cell wall biosynthesis
MNPSTDALVVEQLPLSRPSLRVAMVTETYPPEVNGVALTVQQLVLRLQARHHAIQLVRPRQPLGEPAVGDTALDEVLGRGLPIPRYPQLRLGLPMKRALVSQWTQRRPDLVHVATEGPLGWSALQAARKLKLPVSTDFRTNFHAYSRHYGVGWLRQPIAAYLRKFHNLAQCTMVPTPELQRELSAMGFQRLLVVARGVDTERFSPAKRSEVLRAQWGVAPDQPVMLSVGRLAAEKNLDVLVRCTRAMRQVCPDLKLVVVGDGPERAALQQACPEALLVGSLSGEALAQHYASADLFLFPSLTETYGNVTPEALASGLALLAFDYAAAAELVRHGDNGLLAPFGDTEAFVRRAADMAASPALAQHLRERARSTTLAQDWSQIVGQVEGIWEQLLLQRAGEPAQVSLGALRGWA